MTKFKYPVSMKCTQEQFKKDLRDELVKIGYISSYLFSNPNPNIPAFLCTNVNKIHNYFTTYYSKQYNNSNNRYYIDHYNPKLFLALAGATDNPNGNYGEYFKFKISVLDCFKKDDLYKFIEKKNNYYCFTDNYYSITESRCPQKYFIKPTKEEIINQFTNKIMENKEFTLKDLKNGNIVQTRSGAKYIYLDEKLMDDRFIINTSTSYNNFDSCLYRSLDIMSVSDTSIGDLTNGELDRKILFVRPDKIELTMDEIANKFNISVEQLSIKK